MFFKGKIMQLVSQIYRSADIDSFMLRQQISDYQDGDTYGYFLVDDMLVPKSLVNRIFDHLREMTFDYRYVWSVQELLGSDFWNCLDDIERSVAGACLLIIIENGYSIPVKEEYLIKH